MARQQILANEQEGKEVKEMTGAVLTKEAEVTTPEWLEKALEEIVSAQTPGRPGECILVKDGIVSYRPCTKGYQCPACEFYQMVEETRIIA
ncbi:MAG TPA: hypothetical protein G4O12_04745 [Dehalococcoidia bacterium]|nr:hypothetical protein [Dehalococcoidia bacterium]